MSSNSWLMAYDPPARRSLSTTVEKHTEDLVAEEFERAEKRRLALAELKSEFFSVTDRIRAWEKLHGLRLPSDSAHMVLSVIARCTGLTLDQIRDEQRARQSA
ncbi:MAG: hypothetical protein WDO68_16845 [Gammaproteobacteria bacterium]